MEIYVFISLDRVVRKVGINIYTASVYPASAAVLIITGLP